MDPYFTADPVYDDTRSFPIPQSEMKVDRTCWYDQNTVFSIFVNHIDQNFWEGFQKPCRLLSMKTVAQNRRAKFDYELVETFEAGIQLLGWEVKAIRMNLADLSGAYVSFVSGKAVLKKMSIRPYPFASNVNPDDTARDRTLLLHKKQVDELQTSSEEKGMAIIPLEVKAGRHIKVMIALGRGRKQFDKRHKIKDRESKKRAKMQAD